MKKLYITTEQLLRWLKVAQSIAPQLWFSYNVDQLLQEKIAISRDPHQYRRLVTSRLFTYGYWTFIGTRVLLIGLQQQLNFNLTTWLSIDSVQTSIFLYFHYFQFRYMMHLHSVLVFFFIYIDYIRSFVMQKSHIALTHSLVVHNRHHFGRLNSHFNLPDRWQIFPFPVFKYLKQFCLFLKQLWYCDEAHFAFSQLPHYPNLSTRVRVRAILLATAIEWISVLIYLIGYLIVPIVYLIVLAIIQSYPLPWYQRLLAPLDLLLGFYLIYEGVFTISLFLQSLSIVIFVLHLHINELNGQLRQFLSKLQGKSHHFLLLLAHNRLRNFRITILLKKCLSRFQHDHHFVYHKVLEYDTVYISRILLVAFATNITLNASMLAQCLYRHLAPIELFFIFSAISAQFLLLADAVILLITISNSLHSSAPLLYKAQLLLKPNNGKTVLTKVKLMGYYELVHSNKRYHFHLGSIGAISKKSCLDFLAAYSTYLMWTFKLVQKYA